MGILNTTVVSQENITSLVNASGLGEFMVNVNHTVYSGYLYFVLLWVLWAILFLVAQKFRDQVLSNVMVTGLVVSFVSFFLRAVYVVREGVVLGLVTDNQLWVFPILTLLSVLVAWATK